MKRSRIMRLISMTLAIWVINNWLLVLYTGNLDMYREYRAAGIQWWTCLDWDKDGRPYVSDQCTEPQPPDPVVDEEVGQ